MNTDSSSLVVSTVTGFDPFCQDTTLIESGFPCFSPYVTDTINTVRRGAGSYSTCTSVPILVDDITHPDQCQGASALLNNHCFAQALSNIIGGELLAINTLPLLVGAIGVNPIITGLVGITLAGVAGQAVWFVHRRKKSENS